MSKAKGKNVGKGSAGGSASTGGAAYASAVASWCAVKMMLGGGAKLPWGTPSSARIVEIACESDTEVDDLVLRLEPGGSVYLQIKHGLKWGLELKKAVAQLVRQFHAAGFSASDDRLVIATDHSASGSIRESLKKLISRFQGASTSVSLQTVAKNQAEREVLSKLAMLVKELWSSHTDTKPTDAELCAFFACMDIFISDPLEGNDVHGAIESLGRVVDEANATSIWALLNNRCLKSAWLRQPFDLPGLWAHFRLEGVGVSPRGFPRAIARKMTSQLINLLSQSGRYHRQTYVARSEADELLSQFLANSKRLVIVGGGSGRGKSCWSAYHCDAAAGGARFDWRAQLVRGEDLEPADKSLFASISRLIRAQAATMSVPIVNESEMNEWLREEPLLIFLDGLDRASAAFRGNLNRWLEGTLLDLASSCSKLVVTTRPESIGQLLALLGRSELLYEPHKGVQYLELTDFDKEEAESAAKSLGHPELARFRHPSLMSFSAHIRGAGVDVGHLQPHDIIEAYIQYRTQGIEAESGLLPEAISALIQRLAHTLAESPDGELDIENLDALRSTDSLAYDAVRRNNLLAVHQAIGRVEPDEVSEHLQGKYTDIESAFTRLSEILERPLKLGALRAALIRLAASDSTKARAHIERLLEALTEQRTDVLFSVACAVVSSLREWEQIRPLVACIAKAWPKQNFMAAFGFGKEFLEFLADSRWSPVQQLELLWELAPNESGYDWRQKHWLTPWYAPNYHTTPWRVVITGALYKAGRPGLEFLIHRMSCRDAFSDTSEANLGNVAQGLFVISAEKQFSNALAAATEAEPEIGRWIRRILAERYPNKVIRNLSNAVKQGQVPAKEVSEILEVVRRGNYDAAELLAVIRDLQGLEDAQHWHRECLRILSENGDEAAALELVRQRSIDESDLLTFEKYDGKAFAALAETVFSRIESGDVEMRALLGMRLPREQRDIGLLLAKIAKLLRKFPKEATTIAEVVEFLIYGAYDATEIPNGLISLVEQILALSNADANRNIIYGVTGLQRDSMLTPSGAIVRHQLTELLVAMEADANNVRLMITHLATRHRGRGQAIEWIRELVRRHALVDVLADLRTHASFDDDAADILTELEQPIC